MLNKSSSWYQKKEVANKYDQKRFKRGGLVLDFKEKEIVLSLLEPDGKRILDIATGTGRFAEMLVENGADVVGLDASSEMLTEGRADYLVGDALSLPFADKSFDTTISMRFLHLLKPQHIDDFVKEVRRVTREKFVFESLHPMSLRLLYQWILPQNSRMFSNTFLKNKFQDIEGVKEVRFHEELLIPYGIYQCLPLSLAEKLSELDEKVVNEESWTASTIYWELLFD
ncbi:MAG: class I SAM-dependent methyltransferase [Candidatus Saliniplasma sp.]